jgi:integrase
MGELRGKERTQSCGEKDKAYETTKHLHEAGDWYWGHSTTAPRSMEASAYMDEVAFWDVVDSTKGKQMEALLRYSKWLQRKFNRDEWEFEWTFPSGGGNSGPRDFLTRDERQQIRQAALKKDGNPSYGVDEGELPKGGRNNSWKFTSLVWVSLEAGLRPVEVGKARVARCDTENGVLRIPREESAKNEGNWTVGLTDRTATALGRWLDEREQHPRYDDTDKLWLTRHSNRYGSNELSRILKDLCDREGIPHEDRQMSWYTIRHSVGTYMTKERDLAATKAQLRHRNPKTTMKYDQVPAEERRDALDQALDAGVERLQALGDAVPETETPTVDEAPDRIPLAASVRNVNTPEALDAE